MSITDKYVAALGEIAELKEQIENMSILLNAQKGELNELKRNLALELFDEYDGALNILRDFDDLTDEEVKAIEEKNKHKKYGFEPYEEKEVEDE
jgi:hypothetical protein